MCTLCFVACFKMFLFFIWASFSHLSCTPHASSFTLTHIFFSFPPSSYLICLFMTKRGRVYRRVYRCVLSFLYNSCAHSWGRNSTSCTSIGGEIHRGDAYIKGEKTFFYEKTLFYLMLVFSLLYGALSLVSSMLCFYLFNLIFSILCLWLS